MRVLPVVALLILTIPLATAEGQRRAPVDTLSWLAGCWQGTRGANTMEEQWMAPRGGVVLGVGRTSSDARAASFEFMQVYAIGDTIVYAATPSGQTRAEFRAIKVAPWEIVYENPKHDFPTKVGYRRAGDSLFAFIEGVRGGATRTISYAYRKVTCAGT